jgi:hypothetical protein
MRFEYKYFFKRRLRGFLGGSPNPLAQIFDRVWFLYRRWYISSSLGYKYYKRTMLFLKNEIPSYWRVDARYFLSRNIYLMVVEPYFYADARPGADENFGEFWFSLTSDLREIIELAELTAKERERKYVSATSVAVALGQLAPNLKLTSLQIWGPGEQDD